MHKYRRNHYVPQWFQYKFIPESQAQKKFFYLDFQPESFVSNGKRYLRKDILRWGPPKCFWEQDLYTTKFGEFESTEIEEKFFGKLDRIGEKSVSYFEGFEHPSADGEKFQDFLLFLSTLKLRTPKGLNKFSKMLREEDKNSILFKLQEYQQMHCALWTECVWSLVDATKSDTKFLLSDHPVTVYNSGCYPASEWCRNDNDPDIWLNGTHTIFPLNLNRALILTNLSWARNPFENTLRARPNPELFRGAMFNFTDIQTGRSLDENEVLAINFIIKSRAKRYIAAVEKEWLYPEKKIKKKDWKKIGGPHFLMPDPRSMSFSSEVLVGYKSNRSDAFDAYGRKPWQKDYESKTQGKYEWESFHAFQGEYARIFGPRRRGTDFTFDHNRKEIDDPSYHNYHLLLEHRSKQRMKALRKLRR